MIVCSRRSVPILILALGLLVAAGCSQQAEETDTEPVRLTRNPVAMEKLTYPVAKTVDQRDDYHGTVVADPYRWLEDVDSAETHAWVEAENEVTFGFLDGIPQRDTFRERLTEIWDYTRYSAPFKKAGRTFFLKNDGLQNQSVLYVQDRDGAEPRVLLDPNTLSDDGTIALGGTSISRDGRYLAWATSVSGSDWRTWYVRDIDTGKELGDRVAWSKFSGAEWDADGKGFYYGRYEEPVEGETFESANYFQKLYYHKVGDSQDQDILIYEDPVNKERGFAGSVSEDGNYLVITVWQGSNRNNRLYYKDLSGTSAAIHALLDDNDASYAFLGNEGPVFFVKTNLDAPRSRVVAVDIRQPGKEHWREILAESDDPIDDVTILNNSFVVTYMHDVVNVVKVFDLQGGLINEITMPGLGSVGGFKGRPTDTETFYVFTSFLNPNEIYHYDFAAGKSELFRAPEIAFDFSGYATTQVFYPSKDGTSVPMFLVHRKDLELDGSNPTILYGYGGFNVSMNPFFSPALLPWLEMGGVYTLANLRGGGEYGEEWHEGGMLKNKQNVFDDFIAAAEYLIREGYTNPNRLAIIGGSNGGTLVGAVANQRPELFGAALPAVGVMDMLRFQHFTIGWAWTSDYGSSDDPELFPVLHAYSPYHNLKSGVEYPATLITTADHDDRVVPGHSFKYAARLQECHAGDLPVLIRIQTKAGHGAGKPTKMVIEEQADKFAFLYKVLGLDGG